MAEAGAGGAGASREASLEWNPGRIVSTVAGAQPKLSQDPRLRAPMAQRKMSLCAVLVLAAPARTTF